MKRLAFGFMALVAACGGSSRSDNGGNSTGCGGAPCGGDVVGKWTLVSDCSPNPYWMFVAPCVEPNVYEHAGVTVTGTTEYRTDGTYSESITMSGTAHLTYPAACVTVTCDQIAQFYTSGAATYSCAAGAAGGCVCTVQMVGQTTSRAGTYSTSGSVLTKQDTAISSPARADFCVQGIRFTETQGTWGHAWEKLP
jgi:hypothetical protein